MTDHSATPERKPLKIITEFVYPPIPIRSMDWQAYYDGEEPDDDGRAEFGTGVTEKAAIHDLLVNYPRSGAPCPQCGIPFFFGDTCGKGGCPCGGDV